jgi:hypothetical protein
MGIDAKVTVPDRFIEDMVKAEIVTRLSNDPNILEAFLKEALSAKTNYGRDTKFGAAVKHMVQEAGAEVFKEWLEQNKEKIRAALLSYLNKNKQKMLKDLVEKMAAGLSHYRFAVSLSLKEGD